MVKKQEFTTIKPVHFFIIAKFGFALLVKISDLSRMGGGEDFLRPVLILKKFNNEVTWALPLTRTVKMGKYYFRTSLVFDDGNSDDRPSVVILSQLRLVDAKRFQYKMGIVKEGEFVKIKEALAALLK